MEQFIIQHQWVAWLIVLWTLPWKGIALWKSARGNQQWWFIAMLVINTFAILEILYIFVFPKKKVNKVS